MRKVVFLPCHPSMWEGFETIWDKENNTPDTEVKVIPIPTYERGTDNSLYNAEYITTGYPDNVEICDLNGYDLEADHPDTIYIQNIQDSYNPGFTVHPHFYTSNLRNFTDDLVYIPYNCMPEIRPSYEDLFKYYSSILTPAPIHNIDRIILQSENTKKVYIELLAGANESLRNEWDKKISYEDYPRKSILKKYSKDTIKYPLSWNNYLFNNDGIQKETHLLATSVFGVLEYNKVLLWKIKETFEEYLEKKENLCLIWRPNKNLPDIISKLRPELFEDFRALLEFFISNNIGILDETPSPTPAIILSDAYLGDNCGVKELFLSTKKPVLNWKSDYDKLIIY